MAAIEHMESSIGALRNSYQILVIKTCHSSTNDSIKAIMHVALQSQRLSAQRAYDEDTMQLMKKAREWITGYSFWNLIGVVRIALTSQNFDCVAASSSWPGVGTS